MKRPDLSEMSLRELVELFEQIGLAQDEAVLVNATAKFNRLFDRMTAVSAELKQRDGDQRSELKTLYSASNMQVRLKAAIHTLAVAPIEARKLLEAIAISKWYPQAGDAGMIIRGLDDGTFRPT